MFASNNPGPFVEKVPKDPDYQTRGYFLAEKAGAAGKSLGAEKNDNQKSKDGRKYHNVFNMYKMWALSG